jgi:hypothetical protein
LVDWGGHLPDGEACRPKDTIKQAAHGDDVAAIDCPEMLKVPDEMAFGFS